MILKVDGEIFGLENVKDYLSVEYLVVSGGKNNVFINVVGISLV